LKLVSLNQDLKDRLKFSPDRETVRKFSKVLSDEKVGAIYFSMKIVGIIPCRYGSKRFEGKPLIPILGKPMIQWVYEKAKQADLLEDVVVATDDERIYRCVEGFGGPVLMTATSHRSGSDRAAEAAGRLGLKDEDIVINIQGDQPAFDPRCLSEVVSPPVEDSALFMSTLIYKIKDPAEIKDPNCVKCVFDKDNFAIRYAAANGHIDVVKYLVAACPTVDVTADNNAPIRWAARYGYIDIVKYLVESCPPVDVTADNNAPIRSAADAGHIDIVKYLLSRHPQLYAVIDSKIRELILSHYESNRKRVKVLETTTTPLGMDIIGNIYNFLDYDNTYTT